jgi:hypothetical protein
MGECSSRGINTLKVYPTKEVLCFKDDAQLRQYAKVVVGQKDNSDDQKVT